MAFFTRIIPTATATGNTIKFCHGNRTDATPLLNFTTTVVTPANSIQNYTDSAFSEDFPISISSTDNNLVHNTGSCIHISIPNNNLEPNHAKLKVDTERLVLEHGAKEACTKIFYKDFKTGKYTREGSATLNAANPTALITAPEFKIVSGLIETKVELLPAIKTYVNDVFAIFSIKKYNSGKTSDNNKHPDADDFSESGRILDPVDEKIIIGDDYTSAKVVVRSGYRFGRYEDTEVSFSEDTESRAAFFAILDNGDNNIYSYDPDTFKEILPDGSLKEFEDGKTHPIYTGFKFTDGKYEFCVIDFCDGFDYYGEKAMAELAADNDENIKADDDDSLFIEN